MREKGRWDKKGNRGVENIKINFKLNENIPMEPTVLSFYTV